MLATRKYKTVVQLHKNVAKKAQRSMKVRRKVGILSAYKAGAMKTHRETGIPTTKRWKYESLVVSWSRARTRITQYWQPIISAAESEFMYGYKCASTVESSACRLPLWMESAAAAIAWKGIPVGFTTPATRRNALSKAHGYVHNIHILKHMSITHAYAWMCKQVIGWRASSHARKDFYTTSAASK